MRKWSLQILMIITLILSAVIISACSQGCIANWEIGPGHKCDLAVAHPQKP